MSKALHFLQITAKQQYCQFFTVFLTLKTSSQNISITLLQISLKLHEHRGRYWRKKLPWTILEEQFPVPRYTAKSKIGNSVISLLWQLWCRCNPDHNKFSSLSNTTVVVIFPKLCLWRRSLSSNLGGIDLEKLYRATLKLSCRKSFKIFSWKYWFLGRGKTLSSWRKTSRSKEENPCKKITQHEYGAAAACPGETRVTLFKVNALNIATPLLTK